ncbi:MAG: tRNA (adenosine(37)-N6)-dimethylallyltransferase MiaA [Ruminococcaceae bacterium]|nr:tRNA (adenosine(37)-N6)-dimethylallyltransferase MiaA [Oscillospiraceae bacterium]
MEKIKIICVVGATASGKTALSIELAKRLGGEIISADSMQVYKGMPIATAAVTEEEKQGIPHWLVECFEADKPFSVAEFVSLAKEKAFDIAERGKLPIIAGGTGLFIDSLVNNITFSDVGVDEKLRAELEEKSTDELYDMLVEYDSKAAEGIHKNNRKRVIRALELYFGGTSKTKQNEESKNEESPFEALYIGINYKNRQTLYQRINERVDLMVENGLIDEARQSLKITGETSAQAIGHKELIPYFNNEISLDEALEKIKQETRRYAKRQLTWFRRNEKINWLYADEMQGSELIACAVSLAEEFIKN